ncbi:DUF2271 domain-containing protein [candidate division WOR-3 bacterium]|nr:DUF2271 domain-containing protein [candidate division WOR-3 bacterium]
MRVLIRYLIVLVFIVSAHVVLGKTLEEYVKEAEGYQKTGRLKEAANTMEEAVKEYPGSSDAYAYLGLYSGMQAGETKDMAEAMRLVGESFEMLDKAVSLDSLNQRARFHRGIMAVNVPEFFGKLEGGIRDLEFVVNMCEQSPDKVSSDMIVSVYDLLGKGYQTKGEKEKAKHAWEKVIEIAPETSLAENAEKNIKELIKTEQPQPIKEKKPESATIKKLKEKVKKEPNNPSLLIELGKAYIDARDYELAEKTLKKAISMDSSNVEAYKCLLSAIEGMAMKGYDERIYEDTDLRSNLAFEAMEVFDKIVVLAPDDIKMRLARGATGVEMPFFVGKLDQGIEDLNMVIESDASDSVKAEALYYLGFAYQKKAMTYWIEVVSKYSDSRATQTVFDGLRPAVKHIDLSEYSSPIVVIDFVLGFRDELPPQTVVWIEDKNRKFVKTIYVSGFSGYAKDKQVNLPKWSKSSEFIDVDGITGASIDLGHYIYVWDLKDSSGKKVKSGEYIANVEVAYWPSMKYQLVSTVIKVGKKEEKTVVEEGNFIPYVEVKYIPKGRK